MNQIIKISAVSLLLLLSCSSQKELYKKSEANTYPSETDLKIKVESFYRIENDLQFKIELVNATESSMLIPIRHMKPLLLFSDENIRPKTIVSPNYAFDKIMFSNLSNKKRLKIIEDLCMPFLDEKDFKVLKPRSSYIFTCKLDNYSTIKKLKEYELKVRFQLTDRIKKYCPKFWSGTIESRKFKIEIQ